MSRADTVNELPAGSIEARTEAAAMRLYRLMEIVKLAALATGGGAGMAEKVDTSEVLYYVADELEGVSCDFTETIYELAAKATKKGGAR